jgi:hypothetical protein
MFRGKLARLNAATGNALLVKLEKEKGLSKIWRETVSALQ